MFGSILLKSLCLFLTAVFFHLSFTPPRILAAGELPRPGHHPVENHPHKAAMIAKLSIWGATTCDLLTTLSVFYGHDDVALYVCQNASGLPSVMLKVHPIMLLGTLVTVFSSVLRLWCFKALGQLFVFHVVIQPEHKLITHGPYAWVRHPSYTGLYLNLLGAVLVCFAPGAWSVECAISSKSGLLLIGICVLDYAAIIVTVARRCITEDELLKKNFGRQWEEYAKAVPYRAIPGVL